MTHTNPFRQKPLKILVGAGAVGMFLAIVVWLTELRSSRMETAHPEPVTPHTSSKPIGGANSRESVSETGAQPFTLRERLQEYWGGDWARIEPQLLSEGVDLDAPFDFPQWELVADQFKSAFEIDAEQENALRESYVAWPTSLSAEWISARFSAVDEGKLGPVELAEIGSLCAEDNERLESVFYDYVDTLRNASERAWATGSYQKAPFSTTGLQDPHDGRAVHAVARAYGGWAVKYHLYAEDYPELITMQFDMRQIRRKRDRKVGKYLNELE